VALTLLIGGCGGGDSESATLTKAQFIKEANSICLKGEAKRGQVLNEVSQGLSGSNISPGQKEQLVLEVLTPYEGTTAQLAELDVPDGEEKRVEAIVAAMEEAADRVKADPNTAIVSTAPFNKANKLARGYGLDRCDV